MRVIPRRKLKPRVEQEAPELDREAAVEHFPPTPAPPAIGPLRLRARETFRCEGVLFQAGDLVPLDNPLVQRIVAEYPYIFEPARS